MNVRVRGVGRVPGEPRALMLMLSDVPTDDDMRAIHDHLLVWQDHGRPSLTPLHCNKCDWVGFDPSEAVGQCPQCGGDNMSLRITTSEFEAIRVGPDAFTGTLKVK